MGSILERLTKGVGSNILGQIIGIASSFVLVPVVLEYWGGAIYGEWLALSAAISYFALLDFGVQTYVVNRMTQAYAKGRLDDLHRDLHSSLRVFLIVVGAGFIGLVGMVVLLPLDSIFNLRETTRLTASLTLAFLGCNTLFISIPMGLVVGLYRATGAYSRGQMIGNLLRVIQLCITIGVIWSGFSMTVLAFSWLTLTISGAVFILWELRRSRPEINIGIKLGNISHGWSLFVPSLLFSLMGIAGALNIQGTVLVLSSFLGGVAVAQFSTTRTLSNFIIQIGSMVNTAVWPEITAMEAHGEKEKLRRLCRSLTKLNVFFAIFAALLLRAVGPEFYRLWTGHHLSFNMLLLDIFLVQVILMAFWNSSGIILMAINHHRAYAWLSMANAIATIILALFFVRVWGIVGVALSSLTADMAFSLILVPRLVCRFLGESLITFSSSTVLPGLAIGAGLVVISEWLQPMLIPNVWRLLLLLFCLMGLYLVASYALWLDHEERYIVRRIPQKLWALVTR